MSQRCQVKETLNFRPRIRKIKINIFFSLLKVWEGNVLTIHFQIFKDKLLQYTLDAMKVKYGAREIYIWNPGTEQKSDEESYII